MVRTKSKSWRRVYVSLLKQLNETSTVRGLLGAGVIIGGWTFDSARLDAWTTFAVFISAILKLALPDKWSEYGSDNKG